MTHTLPRTEESVRADSMALFEKLVSDDPAQVKSAEYTIDSMTRIMIREDGFYRLTMNPMTIPASEFTRDYRTSRPMKVVDLEPRSPAAMVIPIAGAPMSLYIRANRYPVPFHRYATHKFMIDVAELLTWHADLRQIISDNSIKDLQAEEDSNLLLAVNASIKGLDEVCPTSGIVQNKGIPGAVDKDFWAEMMSVLPSTWSSLSPKYVILNNVTIWQLAKLDAIEAGPEITGEIARKGWTMKEYMGVTLVITIKKGLVDNREFYLIADPEYVGKAYLVEDVSMHVKRDGHMVSFYSTMYGGGAIGNVNGVAKVTATG